MSILIVDNSRHIQAQLKVMLNSGGYTDLVFASSAKEAFACLGMETPEKATEGRDLGVSKVCPYVSLSMGVASVFPDQKHNRKDLSETRL